MSQIIKCTHVTSITIKILESLSSTQKFLQAPLPAPPHRHASLKQTLTWSLSLQVTFAVLEHPIHEITQQVPFYVSLLSHSRMFVRFTQVVVCTSNLSLSYYEAVSVACIQHHVLIRHLLVDIWLFPVFSTKLL